MNDKLRVVGTHLPRVDAEAKVTGQAEYAVDVRVPGAAYGRILRSPIPHGRIVRLDASRALALPGVLGVVTGADVRHLPAPYFGHVIQDRPVLAIDRVRYTGEPVAALAATTPFIAAEALDLIEVEYAELPAAVDLESALAPDAPQVHSAGYGGGDFGDVRVEGAGANICFVQRQERGDVDAAFAGAAHFFAYECSFPTVFQFPMEPFAVAARWGQEGLELWSGCQHPFIVRSEAAAIFGLDLTQVRVHVPFLGGGYGSKGYTVIEPIVALLARKAGVPVQVILPMEECFLTTRRHEARMRFQAAVDGEGRLCGLRARTEFDTGAYADNGPRVALGASIRCVAAYSIPAFQVECVCVYTHKVPSGSFRGIGAPQVAWALECLLDEIAGRLGLTPVEVRLRNLGRPGEVTVPGKKGLDADLPGGLRLLAAALGAEPGPGPEASPPGRPGAATETGGAGVARGTGLALAVGAGGAGPVSSALVRLNADGSVSLFAGSAEMGQGAYTVLTMICAEELGIPVSKIRLIQPDTDGTPFDRSTGASRVTTVVGTAVRFAATDLRQQVLQIAGDMIECDPYDLRIEAGNIIAPDGQRHPVEKVVQFFFGMRGGELVGRGYSGPRVRGNRVATDPVFWEAALGGATIRVDTETGEVAVEHYVSVSDVGKVIHPGLAHGQETGSVVQGIGHTLFEELHFAGGQLVNPNLIDYRVPTAGDFPARFTSILVENGDGPGPWGAKGMGEGALVPVSAAVGNAFYQATGVRMRELPLSPERVWRALREPGQR